MDKRIEAAKAIIESEFQKPLRLPEIARRVGLSRPHLALLFKRELGFTVMAYLRQERFREASRLLSENHSSMKYAALSAGYGSTAAFRRAHHCFAAQVNPQVAQLPQVRATEAAGFSCNGVL